jgi:hypothetical protein
MKERVFKYLDELRESNITNMYGATPYIRAEFGFKTREARNYLTDWMMCQFEELADGSVRRKKYDEKS